MTHVLKAVATEHCQDRLVAVLEGGYNLEGLADCAEAHIRARMEPGE